MGSSFAGRRITADCRQFALPFTSQLVMRTGIILMILSFWTGKSACRTFGSLVLEKYSFATTHPGRSERQSDGRQGRPERTRITGGEIRDVQEGVSGESPPSNRSGARVVQK